MSIQDTRPDKLQMTLSSLSGDNSSEIMMPKLFLFYIAGVCVMGLSNASIRRIAPSGWQGSSSYESSPIGLARSGGGWDSGASTFSRANGWSGSAGYGANPRSYSNGKSGCSNSNSDSNVGFSSNTGSAFW